jgi:hypothetical protein
VNYSDKKSNKMISELLVQTRGGKIEIDDILVNMINASGSEYVMLPSNGYYSFNVVFDKDYKIIASNNDASKEAVFSVYDAAIATVLRTIIIEPGKTVSIPVVGNNKEIVCINTSKEGFKGACVFVSLYSVLK